MTSETEETVDLTYQARAPEAGREGAAERLAIVAEKPAHLIRWGEGDRLDLQSVLAALSPPSTGGALTGGGWVYNSPDTGMEYAPNHPVASGEVPDATDIRASTQFEDWLVREAAVNRPTSPEMGEISREEIARIIMGFLMCQDDESWPIHDDGSPFDIADAILSKLKENGLSREGLGGLARSQPGSDAQERSPVPPLSDGPWRCFQCGELFADERAAAGHFGKWSHQSPACMAGETFQVLKTAYNHLETDFDAMKSRAETAEAALRFARCEQ